MTPPAISVPAISFYTKPPRRSISWSDSCSCKSESQPWMLSFPSNSLQTARLPVSFSTFLRYTRWTEWCQRPRVVRTTRHYTNPNGTQSTQLDSNTPQKPRREPAAGIKLALVRLHRGERQGGRSNRWGTPIPPSRPAPRLSVRWSKCTFAEARRTGSGRRPPAPRGQSAPSKAE